MTKAELIKALTEKMGNGKITVAGVVDALGDVVPEMIGQGVTVVLPGVGRLVVVERAARAGRNPKTGEAISIPAKRDVKFKPAKDLRDVLTQ